MKSKNMLRLQIQLFAEGVPGEPGPLGGSSDPLEKQYLEQIESLKIEMEQMVPGEEYERVLSEHRKLTDEYINKRTPPVKEENKLEKVEVYAAKLKDNKFKSNKEFLETSLNYRDSYILETGKDPWSDAGDITEDTKNVAGHIKKLLEENPDSSSEFNYRFKESLVDDPQLMQMLRTKK